MADYDIDIEIDADTGEITWIKNGIAYNYTVEELEGKGLIERALHGGADVTVYSQGERYTKEEYEELMGDNDL
jgi:dihydroorotase-like cyclic amidohydrolase